MYQIVMLKGLINFNKINFIEDHNNRIREVFRCLMKKIKIVYFLSLILHCLDNNSITTDLFKIIFHLYMIVLFLKIISLNFKIFINF